MAYDIEALQKNLETRQDELDLLNLAVRTLTPDLERLAALSVKYPAVLPAGLVIYGREMPEGFAADGAPAEPGAIQARSKGRTFTRHTGALRVVMTAVAAELDLLAAEASAADPPAAFAWPDACLAKDRIRERAEVGVLPYKVFHQTILDAVKGGLLRFGAPDRSTVALTQAGLNRVQVYREMGPHRVRVVDADVADAADEKQQREYGPTPPAPDAPEEPLVALTPAILLDLLPASRGELQDALDSAAYETCELRSHLHGMESAGEIHQKDGVYHRGPKPPAEPRGLLVAVADGAEIRTAEDWLGRDRLELGTDTIAVLMAIGRGQRRTEDEVRRDSRLGFHAFNSAVQQLVRCRYIRNFRDRFCLTRDGEYLVANVAAPIEAQMAVGKRRIG